MDETPRQRVRRLQRTGLHEADALVSTAMFYALPVTADSKLIRWRLRELERVLSLRWQYEQGWIDVTPGPPFIKPSHNQRVMASHPWRMFRQPI